MASSPDLLFGLRNNFFLGAYQAAINNSDVPNLSQEDAIERDSLVYRSYIALRSYQVSISSPIFSKHENPNKTHISNLLISSPFSSSASSVHLSPAFAACHQRDRFVRAHASPGREIARNLSLRARKQGRYSTVIN